MKKYKNVIIMIALIIISSLIYDVINYKIIMTEAGDYGRIIRLIKDVFELFA